MNDLLTIQEARQQFFNNRLSSRAVLDLYHAGKLPGFRARTGKGKILLYRAGLQTYVEQQSNQPGDDPPDDQGDQEQRPPPPKPSRHSYLGPCRLPRLPT